MNSASLRKRLDHLEKIVKAKLASPAEGSQTLVDDTASQDSINWLSNTIARIKLGAERLTNEEFAEATMKSMREIDELIRKGEW
jgi:hypothetical protein